MVIETTTVVLLVMSYFYTRQANDEWPPTQSNLGTSVVDPRPALGVATMDVLVLLASCLPAAWMHRRREGEGPQPDRLGPRDARRLRRPGDRPPVRWASAA